MGTLLFYLLTYSAKWVGDVFKQYCCWLYRQKGLEITLIPPVDSEKLSVFIIGVFIKHFYEITFSLIILPSAQQISEM